MATRSSWSRRRHDCHSAPSMFFSRKTSFVKRPASSRLTTVLSLYSLKSVRHLSMSFVTAKTSAGGRLMVTLCWMRGIDTPPAGSSVDWCGLPDRCGLDEVDHLPERGERLEAPGVDADRHP